MKLNSLPNLALSCAILTIFLTVSCSQKNQKEEKKDGTPTQESPTDAGEPNNDSQNTQNSNESSEAETATAPAEGGEQEQKEIIKNPTVESEDAQIEGKSKGDGNVSSAMYYCTNQNLIGFGNSNASNVVASDTEEAIQKVLENFPAASGDNTGTTSGISCQKIDIPLSVLEKVELRYKEDFPEKTGRLLLNGEKASFSNGCLDAPAQGEICTFAFVDGYKVRVESSIDGVVYHLSLDASMIRQASTFVVPQ